MPTSEIRKKLFSAALLVLLLAAAELLLTFLLEPVSHERIKTDELRAIEKSGGSIDILFEGNSRIRTSFDPFVFEEELGMSAFNLATGLQPISSSYFHLKDAIERFHPQIIVLGVSWDMLTDHDGGTAPKLAILDEYSGLTRAEFVFSELPPADRMNLLRSFRFRFDLNRKNILKNIQNKLHPDQNPADEYLGKGYFRFTDRGGHFLDMPLGKVDSSALNRENIAYLDKITDLCAEKGVRLFLVSGLTSMMTIYNVQNYQDAVDFFETYAEAHGIPYHNVNYLKDREEWLPDAMFGDSNHCNNEGAVEVSKRYAKVIRDTLDGVDTSDAFYGDLEALKATVHRIVSIGADVAVEDRVITIADIRAPHGSGMHPLFEAAVSADGDNWTTIMDWTDSPYDLTESAASYQDKVFIRLRVKADENAEPIPYIWERAL